MSSMALTSTRAPQTKGVANHLVLPMLHASTSARTASATARSSTFARKLLNSMPRHLPIQRRATQPQRLRRLAQVTAMLGDRLENSLLLQRVQIQRGGLLSGMWSGQQSIELQSALVAHDHQTLDGVAQLAYVARPMIVLEPLERGRIQRRFRFVVLAGV